MHRIRRALPYVAALSIGLATAVVAGAQPASAVQTMITPATWAYTEAQQPRTAFVNPAGDLPIGTTTDAGGVTHTRRSYFTYDLTRFKGNSLSNADLSALITPDAACTTSVQLELWRTGKLNQTPTWRNAPTELELVRQWPRGCDGWFVDTSLTDVVTAARARGDRTLTFELRVAQADEAVAGSGFLITKPETLVTHNAIPVVRNPGLERDGRCGTLERPRPANRGAQVGVTVTDADPRPPWSSRSPGGRSPRRTSDTRRERAVRRAMRGPTSCSVTSPRAPWSPGPRGPTTAPTPRPGRRPAIW
ncbi:hypothetical protein [Dactylosporangium cerinum]